MLDITDIKEGTGTVPVRNYREEYKVCKQHVENLQIELEFALKDLAAAKRRLEAFDSSVDAGQQYKTIIDGLMHGGMPEADARSLVESQLTSALAGGLK